MSKLKDFPFFHEAIHEINYPFGDFYLFDGFVVAEINEGVHFTWEDHAQQLVKELVYLYDSNSPNLVLIANRVNSYSVKPTNWAKFYKNGYALHGYAVVNYSKMGRSIALIEKLFVRTKSKSFNSLSRAINWAKKRSKKRIAS